MFSFEILPKPEPHAANCYLINSGGEYALIDPASPPREEILPNLKYILLTHCHFDHILYIDKWAESGARVYIAREEKDFLSDPQKNCYGLFFGLDRGYFGKVEELCEGDELLLGEERIRFLRFPGHTTGSGAYLIGESLFVGDTVFSGGGFGRWDLPSGNYSELRESIKRIISLPDSIRLYPGHGDHTTISEYKAFYKG